MNRPKNIFIALHVCLLAIFAIGISGCAMMKHELQPHRLWRMNRTAPMSGDPYFSVSDPVTNSVREQRRARSDVIREASPVKATFTSTESPTATANAVAPIDGTATQK